MRKSYAYPHYARYSLSWVNRGAIYHKFKGAGYSQRYWTAWNMERHDPRLVHLVEELGPAANGAHAELRIVEIPADVEYTIEEYDGREHIAESHRTWD